MSDFIAQYEDEIKPSVVKAQNKVEPEAEIKEEIKAPMDESDIIEAEKTADIKTEEKDPIDEAARSQGWVPQEEWDGDPTQSKSFKRAFG